MGDPVGPVVSNTTPLIMLAGIQHLDILAALYGEVWIPDTVRIEYQRGAKPGDLDVDTLAWIRVHAIVRNPAISPHLDAGEAAALSLAIASGASLVLLDERQARKEATRLGLRVAGSLAALVEAKQHGLISHVAPLVDVMIAQERYFSDELRARILELAGEQITNP